MKSWKHLLINNIPEELLHLLQVSVVILSYTYFK